MYWNETSNNIVDELAVEVEVMEYDVAKSGTFHELIPNSEHTNLLLVSGNAVAGFTFPFFNNPQENQDKIIQRMNDSI